MSVQETNGYLDVENATLRSSAIEATSRIGIANTNPQHAFSVGSNLYIDAESSDVLTIKGNVVTEGVKVGLIEIIPSYDFAAVSNVGNVTQSTIQFSNATTGFVTTANIEVGTANLFVDTVTGRVGIGKTDPTAALDVVGNVAVDTNTLFVDSVGNRVGIGTVASDGPLHIFKSAPNNGDTGPGIIFTRYTNTYGGCIWNESNNDIDGLYFNVFLNTAASTAYGATPKMVINSNGNVGIGTIDPGGRLELGHYGTEIGDFAALRMTNFATNLHPSSLTEYNLIVSDINNGTGLGNGKFSIAYRATKSAGYSHRLVIDGNGNVGIGTTNPDKAQLQVTNSIALVSHSYKSGADDDQVAGRISFFLGGDANERATPVAAIEGYDKYYSGGSYAGALAFKVHGAERMRINEIGNVGIGTENPRGKLDVNGNVDEGISSAKRTFFYWENTTTLSSDTSGWGGTCILGRGNILALGYFVSHSGTVGASDIRIKKNIVDADDVECLETLRLLKPKKYKYKDEINRGQETVWGFIAQEVRETLPYATQLRRDVLPNIYELANVSQSNVITFVNFNTSNLESNATTRIRINGIDNKDHDVHLVEVIDENSIRVEENLSSWIGSVDAEGNVITQIETTTLTVEEYEALEDKAEYVANISGYQNANVMVSVEEYNGLEDTTGYKEVVENYTKTTIIYPGTQLFVYGQEVDDFIFLKKEAIWTVATAALQEVDRQQQADKLRIAELETQLTSVLARLDALEAA